MGGHPYPLGIASGLASFRSSAPSKSVYSTTNRCIARFSASAGSTTLRNKSRLSKRRMCPSQCNFASTSPLFSALASAAPTRARRPQVSSRAEICQNDHWLVLYVCQSGILCAWCAPLVCGGPIKSSQSSRNRVTYSSCPSRRAYICNSSWYCSRIAKPSVNRLYTI